MAVDCPTGETSLRLVRSVLPNVASKSRHEQPVMAPVSLVLAVLAFSIALG